MLSLRAHAWTCAGLFAALIGIAILGNVLEAAGAAPPPRAYQLPFMIAYLTLFLAFVLSAIPVIVKTVLRAQAGNAHVEPIAALIRQQDRIIWVLWILILLGLAVALPAIIADGFFTPGSG